MNRPTRMEEGEYDSNWKRKCGWLDRLVIRLARKQINAVTKGVLTTAYERGQIDSGALHVMAACTDMRLWPERYERKCAKPDNEKAEP